jgi:hypothetical protein
MPERTWQRKSLGSVAVFAATRCVGRGKCLIHDAADGSCASPALSTATETIVNFAGGARGSLLGGKRRSNVVVGQHIAGADDHRSTPGRSWYQLQLSLFSAGKFGLQTEKALFVELLTLCMAFGRRQAAE